MSIHKQTNDDCIYGSTFRTSTLRNCLTHNFDFNASRVFSGLILKDDLVVSSVFSFSDINGEAGVVCECLSTHSVACIEDDLKQPVSLV